MTQTPVRRLLAQVAEDERRDPTMDEIDSPEFNAVWDAVKMWDIQRYPGAGYAGATGTDVITILDALEAIVPTRAAQLRVLVEALERVEWEATQQDDVAGSDPEWVMERIASIAHNALSAAARIGDADAT